MSNYILRQPTVCERLGVGNTVFHAKFVGDGFVPGTNVPRLKPVPLGLRSVGYFADELDALIEGMRRWRDANPRRPVTVGRVAASA
jgi:predicted DNA-binding transcriptional regulator AlpA